MALSTEETGIHKPRPTIDETAPLLNPSNRDIDQEGQLEDVVDQKWADEVLSDQGQTSWRHETAVIVKSALPMIVTFTLQYSLTSASVFSTGHLGKIQLGGVALGTMSAAISGNMVYQGLATALDTLCAQAYGSGKKELVGVHMQRMFVVLLLITIPISILWTFSAPILKHLVPDAEVARLASLYLRASIFGLPGYAAFECGKRFTQAQGLFSAATWVMLFVAPLNAFLNWLLVWKLQWGFVGAPIATVISQNILPLGLFAYVYFVDGRQCWGGFSRKAFTNWGPMMHLAIPGFFAIAAEYITFEIFTFVAAQIGTAPLAAQSVLLTVASTTFQIQFPLSIAASTRIGNLVGATLSESAKIATKVTLCAAIVAGVMSFIILSLFRFKITYLFNSDPEVVALVAHVLPLVAAFQMVDSMAANCNGILRGVGQQKITTYVQVPAYYLVGMPISLATAFTLKWGLMGLWTGVLIALFLVSVIELIYIRRINWQRCVDAAIRRNSLG